MSNLAGTASQPIMTDDAKTKVWRTRETMDRTDPLWESNIKMVDLPDYGLIYTAFHSEDGTFWFYPNGLEEDPIESLPEHELTLCRAWNVLLRDDIGQACRSSEGFQMGLTVMKVDSKSQLEDPSNDKVTEETLRDALADHLIDRFMEKPTEKIFEAAFKILRAPIVG